MKMWPTPNASDDRDRGHLGMPSIRDARERQAAEPFDGGQRPVWRTEPNVGRVANGVPRRSHRLKQLGNAVVPQVVEQIAKSIWRIEYATNEN